MTEWGLMSTNDRAEVMGLTEKVVNHPSFYNLKKAVDRTYARMQGKGSVWIDNPKWFYRYLTADPGLKRNPSITTLQDEIAHDIDIILTRDTGKLKGINIVFPQEYKKG